MRRKSLVLLIAIIVGIGAFLTFILTTYSPIAGGTGCVNGKPNEYTLFVATVFIEGGQQDKPVWKGIGSVIMNRMGQGEWADLTNVTEVINKSGFNATDHARFDDVINYFCKKPNKLKDEDKKVLHKMARALKPIYFQQRVTTDAVYFYSPKLRAQIASPSAPKWASPDNEVKVPGVKASDDLKFYKANEP